MMKATLFARGAMISGAMLLIATTTPAFAEGKADRARQAIAEARAKVDVADKLGASGDVPRLQADARAALKLSEEDLHAGHKEDSIAAAIHAGKLADEAIGYSQQHQAQAMDAQASQTQAAAAAANDANNRAANAEQAAASAQADAAAARAQPPVIVAQAPAQPATTTVTTETTKESSARSGTAVKKKVVAHPAATAARSSSEQTTTTVSTTPAG